MEKRTRNMKWIYPRRLRNQMILMAILMVIVPTLTIGYIVETEGRSAVLSEKEKKLSAVVNLLNQALGDRYDLYIDLPREERIRALNAELAPITENITRAFPGIGAGYYNKTLDAIITYAPSSLYQNNVGVTIAADHPGREVMRTNTPLVYSGRQVRGDILNSMIPIERNGEVLGYIWANELTEDIRRQAWKMDVRIIIVLTAGLLISLLLIVLFSRRLSANIDIITDGLSNLAQNIPTRLPQLPGEMGQISQSVNNLAQALRETRTLNDLIIENAADGVIAIDRQGDVTTMNPAAEVITGYQRHELVGQPYSMLFDNTQFYSPVLDTLEHGTEHVALEISFPGRDRTIELSVTTSRIHNTHGEMIGALVIFSDLTARKETQRRMAQAERLATLGELMAGVAHEVRNPLTAIRGYVQILRQQTTDPIHQEYLSVVLKEIDSINKVIQQLLDFSRPRHSQWQQVSLNALIEETLVLVQTAGVQARVDFISELDNELSPISADRELLKQVLLNILINAVQAISARGKIRIRTWQYSDSQQAISIEDNGCGIDLSLQKKIFDPFFTTKASGTGLGLALSQRIINAHQGDIRVTSLPGYGATFTLILPINPQGNQTV
ncbi:histidine kinase [Escherichia coli]|nr:histidine kinase [Escherichia coli]